MVGSKQLSLRWLLVVAAIVPPVIGWTVWITPQLNVLGVVFSLLLPVGVFGAFGTGALFFRKTRWLTALSLVLSIVSVTLVMPASAGPEFIEVGMALAVFSTAAGGLMLILGAIVSFFVGRIQISKDD